MWTLSFLCRKVYNYKFNLKNRYRAFKFHNIYPWSVSPQCSSFLCVDPDFYLILLSFRFPLIFLVIQASRLWTPSAFMFEKAFILPLFLNDIEFSVDRVFFITSKVLFLCFLAYLYSNKKSVFNLILFFFQSFLLKFYLYHWVETIWLWCALVEFSFTSFLYLGFVEHLGL